MNYGKKGSSAERLHLCLEWKLSSEVFTEVVMYCVDGSPAALAGIHEGDELVEINGGLQEFDASRNTFAVILVDHFNAA
ncbi:putative PDZ domain-containing protein [Rosa chinensis]|uniref:Putative PDZ domain-containing protein n=1 Tax=Rosa chinensis TaxID=74649 RepID=A0A2P6P781_ROSCH|nr:putative PDZ domain-containing protein [Rosa chinensis]